MRRPASTPTDLSFCEVHDCFTIAEIMVIEALGLSERGKGGEAAASGVTALGGQIPVNPSGGLKSKGHPVGATGIAQIREAVLQLRGEADGRQVKDARWGLTQNMGGTGASSVVHIFDARVGRGGHDRLGTLLARDSAALPLRGGEV